MSNKEAKEVNYVAKLDYTNLKDAFRYLEQSNSTEKLAKISQEDLPWALSSVHKLLLTFLKSSGNCPVCLEASRCGPPTFNMPHILPCFHIVCKFCVEKLDKCPICRNTFDIKCIRVTNQYGSAVYYTNRHYYPSGKSLVEHLSERFFINSDQPRMFCPDHNDLFSKEISSEKNKHWIWVIGLSLI